MPDLSVVPIIVSALTGGAVGAVITAIATHRRNQKELAMKFVEKYIDLFGDIAEAKTLAMDPASLSSAANRNKIGVVANWFEVVATCYLSGAADGKLLKTLGLPEAAQNFFKLLQSATVVENGVSKRAFSEDRLKELTHLSQLARGAVPNSDLS